jgi:type II secretion system protein L
MRLRIWLPALAELRPESPLVFEVLDAQRRVRNRGEAVLAGLPRGMDCELVLHPLDAVLLEVRLPRLRGARLAGALPGLVEARVAGDIELAHVVASAPDGEGGATAAVVDRALLRRALELFQRAGQRVAQATPAPLALGMTPGNWRARVRNGQGSVRTGPLAGAGFAVVGAAPLELRLLLSQAQGRPASIEVEGECDVAAWSQALGVDVARAVPDRVAAPIVLDLLQHQFSGSLLPWQTWRPTLVLGAVLAAVAVGGLNLHAAMLRAQERMLRAEMVRMVQEVDPQVPVVLDPVAQMRRRLADLRAGAGTDTSGFLALAADFARIAGPDAAQSLQYRDGRLAVRLQAAPADDAQRAALSERAAAAGLTLTLAGDVAQVTRRPGP